MSAPPDYRQGSLADRTAWFKIWPDYALSSVTKRLLQMRIVIVLSLDSCDATRASLITIGSVGWGA
jgi:hypothetical protein